MVNIEGCFNDVYVFLIKNSILLINLLGSQLLNFKLQKNETHRMIENDFYSSILDF